MELKFTAISDIKQLACLIWPEAILVCKKYTKTKPSWNRLYSIKTKRGSSYRGLKFSFRLTDHHILCFKWKTSVNRKWYLLAWDIRSLLTKSSQDKVLSQKYFHCRGMSNTTQYGSIDSSILTNMMKREAQKSFFFMATNRMILSLSMQSSNMYFKVKILTLWSEIGTLRLYTNQWLSWEALLLFVILALYSNTSTERNLKRMSPQSQII